MYYDHVPNMLYYRITGILIDRVYDKPLCKDQNEALDDSCVLAILSRKQFERIYHITKPSMDPIDFYMDRVYMNDDYSAEINIHLPFKYASEPEYIDEDTLDEHCVDWYEQDCLHYVHGGHSVMIDIRKAKDNVKCSSCYKYFCDSCSEHIRENGYDSDYHCINPDHKYDYANRIIHDDENRIICAECAAFCVPDLHYGSRWKDICAICRRCADHEYKCLNSRAYRRYLRDTQIIGFNGEERFGTFEELIQWKKDNGL